MGRKRLYASATLRKRAQRARESAARAHQLDARPAVVAVVRCPHPLRDVPAGRVNVYRGLTAIRRVPSMSDNSLYQSR